MHPAPNSQTTSLQDPRTTSARSASVALRRGALPLLAGVGLIFATGCDVSTARHDFRGASSSGIETGVRALLGGVVDGVFAVFNEGTNASSGPSGSLATGSSGSSTSNSTTSSGTGSTTP